MNLPHDWSEYVITSAGVLVLFAVWLSLFTAGILVDSEPYRQVISPQGVEAAATSPQNASPDTVSTPGSTDSATALDPVSGENNSGSAPPTNSAVLAFVVALFTFTPSNLALLSCTAGVLGAMGRRATLTNRENPNSLDRIYPLLSAVLRGFFVFLVVISGLLVLLENPILGTTSPGQYIRFGGLISLTSFIVNYEPTVFANLMNRVQKRMRDQGIEEIDSAEDEEEEEDDHQ